MAKEYHIKFPGWMNKFKDDKRNKIPLPGDPGPSEKQVAADTFEDFKELISELWEAEIAHDEERVKEILGGETRSWRKWEVWILRMRRNSFRKFTLRYYPDFLILLRMACGLGNPLHEEAKKLYTNPNFRHNYSGKSEKHVTEKMTSHAPCDILYMLICDLQTEQDVDKSNFGK